MKKLIIPFVGLLAFSAFAGIRSVTPVSRESESWWRERHQQKLAEIAANTNRSYDVVFVGDSITDFWERRLRKRWDHWFSYGKLRALNLGFSADRTEHVLWRIENGELDGYSSKAVVLMIGTNNSGQLAPEDEAPADTIIGVKKIMNVIRAKQPNARIILMAIFPRGKDADDPVRRRNEIVNRELVKLCDDHSTLWADINQRFLTADGRLSRRIMPDYLHPSDEGYDIWASAILPLLREICLSPAGRSTPYPKMLPVCIPDREWTDRPAETIGDTHVSGQVPKREEGPFGAWWWLNRLYNRRSQALAAKGKTVDVVLMGDSITHFWEWRHPESWKKFTSRYSAINCGYGGDRTQDVIWRAENGELDGYKAKAVVLEIGTNNATLGSKAEDTAAGIKECIAVIRRKQPVAKVVLHPIFPRGHDTAKSRAAHERERMVNEQVNAIIKSYADGKDVIWVDFNDKWLPAGWGVPPALMADAIHPSDEGYDLWMSVLNPVLDRICYNTRQ